jgi:hypothetical protein
VQGKQNVSHGCVNVSEAMGAWLFGKTMMGDPITVSGTEEKLKNGNGWTDWNMSWDSTRRAALDPAGRGVADDVVRDVGQGQFQVLGRPGFVVGQGHAQGGARFVGHRGSFRLR